MILITKNAEEVHYKVPVRWRTIIVWINRGTMSAFVTNLAGSIIYQDNDLDCFPRSRSHFI